MQDGTTIDTAFAAAVEQHGDKPFLIVPANEARDYLPSGFEISYRDAATRIAGLAECYRSAGFGYGQRIATLLENRPEAILHKLALNSIGACCVPINPDYRANEIAYLVDHSEPEIIVALPGRTRLLAAAIAGCTHRPAIVASDDFATNLVRATRPANGGRQTAETPSSILYTSGTTGRPKGCVLSHGYEIAGGRRYADLGGAATLRIAQDRVYNPLPLYHVNAGVFSLFGVILTGNCQIQPDRFNPQRWWPEIVTTRATIAHYVGVVTGLLLNQAPSADELAHQVRFGLGAGIEPDLHRATEERFGIPFIELWGMTEIVRVLIDSIEPRQVGTRAFGRPLPDLEARVVDDNDGDVDVGMQGELVVRHSATTPRRDFFSGYLKDEAATEAVWRGGWFHTGDVVRQDAGGMLYFVDRKKNIIRRSGENIAAAEVEATLLTHPDVHQAVVMAIKDDLREEEVLACVVLKAQKPAQAVAEALFNHCQERLAYYKAPGWIHIVESIPTTGTQKVQKHAIYPAGTDPRALPDIIDLRSRKRRQKD